MSSRAIVRRRRNSVVPTYGNRALWGTSVVARNVMRRAMRHYAQRFRQRVRAQARQAVQRAARQRRYNANRGLGGNKQYTTIRGNASGTTHTTTRMIVRKTPREQRFLRKMFQNNPIANKYVNRFGFVWMGESAASKTTWYSICHLKFNNIVKYMQGRIIDATQDIGQTHVAIGAKQAVANNPDAFIYIGKCTFSYELYNPTNYIMTVYIYDLICKRDTPHVITYSDVNEDASSAPENCMQKGSESMFDSPNAATWTVADPTLETGTFFNTVGMKPTDYHLFNTLWKVKGIKKIVLPPTASHHHVVVFNPKLKVTNASLFYPRENLTASSQNGIGGLTQATLFGFQGQVAVEDNQSTDNTKNIGTLPGKLLVNCVKKVNIYNMTLNAKNIISESSLKTAWTKPTIFSDLVEVTAGAT